MKRFLLSIIAVFAMSMCSFAQDIVCTDNACTPITDQTFSNTSVPYYCPQSLTFEQGQAVDVCITIKCPETTNVTVSLYGASIPATANIVSLSITELSNLPEGLSYCVSHLDMDPITDDKYATIHITGTAPAENGDYDINLSGIFTGDASAFSQTIPLDNENVTFATGIVLTIGEGSDIPDPVEIVCSDPCPAVTDQTMSQTTIPYYAPEALTYSVNEPVNSCITIKCPATTTVEYMGMPIQASISSMTITGFSNLPDGMTYCVSRVDMDPTTNNFATLHLEGTPTATGDFNLDISCNVSGTANVFGNNTDLNNQAVTFPTGIVVTITEQPSNPVVADFTTDPEATQLLGGSVINITVGETITYTNASENATSIAWTFEGGNPTSSTDNTVEVTYATAGDYTTTLTAYGANNEQSTKTVGVKVSEEGESSIDENMASKISVYPNPTSTVINIAAEGMQNITIMDMTGRVVMNKDVNSNFETINAEGFAKANYMVRIATADGVVVKNIVIE